MAETSTKGLGFLTQKAGPLPLWGWLAAGLGIWWYLNKNNKTPNTAGQPGTATDPAGNTGIIDPLTGYVYDSPQDISALQQQAASQAALSGATGGGASGGGGADGGTVGGTSSGATNTSGANNTGAPAGGPAATPAPVPAKNATPPNSVWSYPAPGGLRASSIAKNGYYLNWNPVHGPGGQTPASYTVETRAHGARVNIHTTAPGSTQTAEYGPTGHGLAPGTYQTNVWANGGPQAPPHATVSVTLKG